jgi:DNA-binding MarR family transcriptional regulator
MGAVTEAEPTTDDELEVVMRAARVFAGVTAESIAQAGDAVTPPQLRVLVLASGRGRLNTTAVATALGVHLSNASRICDRLVTAGLLHRGESPDDRRNVDLTLTIQGRELVATVMSYRGAVFRRILERMSADDTATLTRGLTALSDAAGDLTVPGFQQF